MVLDCASHMSKILRQVLRQGEVATDGSASRDMALVYYVLRIEG